MSRRTRTTPATDEEDTVKPPEEMRGGGVQGRWGAAGMPLERSKDFKNSTRRLAARLRPEGFGVALVLILAVASVTLLVIAPKILGNATNIIVDGVTSGKGIDFTKLHNTLLVVLGDLRRRRRSWRSRRDDCSPASCSARCSGCARTSRTSSTACRCATSTASRAATCSAGSRTTSTTSRRACSRR